VEDHAATDEAADRVSVPQGPEREGEHRLDLARVRLERQLSGVRDQPDERMDPIAGGEGRGRAQLPGQLDRGGVEADLLLRLAQGRRREVRVALVAAPAREGDLPGVSSQVGPPLGEDQAGIVGPAEERQQDRRLDTAQMITWTVPPSTDQAAPLT
jgi:hypothetical protein